MFGRGGEEKTHLEALGIAVEVVHGVTAGIAAPGAVGVPVTHREVTPGCIFITGHEKRGGTPIDWRAVAATRLTLVVYMGVARVIHIRDELLAGGLAANLPAVVIRNASLPDQRAIATTLGQLPQDIETHAIKSPAIMVIGDVAKFADLASVPAQGHAHAPAAPDDRVCRPAG
jgi:uroporphyrin-III C-methyltransferase